MNSTLDRAVAAARSDDWPEAVAWLQPLVDEGPTGDRWSAELLELVVAAATCRDAAARRDGAKLMAQIGAPALVVLRATIEDSELEFDCRWQAGRLLGLSNTPEAIALLTDLLVGGDNEELMGILAGAVASAGGRAIAGLAALLDDPKSRPTAVQALAKICHPDIVEPLLGVCGDDDPQVRATAIESLANFAGDRVDAVLLAALGDRAAVVRRAAASGLGAKARRSPVPDLLDRLRPLLRDLDFATSEQAAAAIARLETPAAADAIAQVLWAAATPLPLQRELLRCLLWTGTDRAIALTDRWLTDVPETPLRLDAVRHLGRLRDRALHPAAAAVIHRHCADLDRCDLELKQAIAVAAANLGDQQLRPLLEALGRDRDRRVALQAASSLKRLDAIAPSAP